jgi:hypothetical protein
MSDVNMQSNAQDDLANDLVWGVAGIGKVINRSQRQVFHMISTRQLPVKKIGGRYCASRMGLRKFFAALVDGEVA